MYPEESSRGVDGARGNVRFFGVSAQLLAQATELKAQLTAAKEQLEQQRQAAVQAVKRAAAAEAAATAAEAEASTQAARVAEVEKEMGQLLAVVEAQKTASAIKMRQLATLLQDM